MKTSGHLFGWFAGVVVLLGLLASPGCSNAPSENFTYTPKKLPSRDELQKAEYERDKAAKQSAKTSKHGPR